MVVWGCFAKTVISKQPIMGFNCAIYQMKGYFSLYQAVYTQMRSHVFPRTCKIKSYFVTFIF